MQSVADNPANQANAQQSRNLLKGLAHTVHKLTNEIAHILFPIGKSLSTLINEQTYLIDDQPCNHENIPLHILLQKEFTFQVDVNLTSSATRVMFNNSDQTRQQICLKMWLECRNDLYNTG